MSAASRLDLVYAAIDEANAADPGTVVVDGASAPANLAYGRRMTTELAAFDPAASEPLRIAARGQHIERWVIPRASYPLDRAGYHRWRTALREHHALRLANICRAAGYDDATVGRVRAIVRKEKLREDPEVQTLEDVVCIVFLKYEVGAFAAKYDGGADRLADILAKTWRKMSPRGHAAALALPPAPEILALLRQGLERSGS